MSLPKTEQFKRVRRVVLFVAVFGTAGYFAPIPVLILFVCGALDVGRHKKINYMLIERYFMGNGIPTWLLSPVNLIADLFSYRNIGKYKLEDLPAEHRREIETAVRAFVENGPALKAHIANSLDKSQRTMLTFKWYNVAQETDLRIPAFEREYRYIKTIAISVFNTREKTTWHFGPLRLTFRVLCNLDPIDSREVFIDVDDVHHCWADNPLFIFDDTFFHQSINNVDKVRYCLFMDIVRPNHAQSAFNAAVHVMSVVAASFKRVFYKHWSFIR